MRPFTIITLVVSIFVITAAAGKHKPSACDKCYDRYNDCVPVSIHYHYLDKSAY